MPLGSRDLGPLVGGEVSQVQVGNLWVDAVDTDGGTTVLRVGDDFVRVNVTKAGPLPNTAMGRALSWLRSHEGETVTITGPDAMFIAKTYQEG